MDGQTARRILTNISEWIAIYPRGNIGGSLRTQQSSKGSSTWSLTFNRRASLDHVCLLVAASSEFNINIHIERLQYVHSPAYGRFGRMDVHLYRPLAGLSGNAGYLF